MKRSVLCGLLVLAGCSPVGTLSGRYVFLAEGETIAVGQANTPAGGGPVHLLPGSPAAGACLPSDEYDRMFGERCEHEPEGGSEANMAYVRWYCGGAVAVRVRLEPCEQRDRLRVAEVAVATQ